MADLFPAAKREKKTGEAENCGTCKSKRGLWVWRDQFASECANIDSRYHGTETITTKGGKNRSCEKWEAAYEDG